MTDSHDAHHGPSFSAYVATFVALSLATVLSFTVNVLAGSHPTLGTAAIIMFTSVVKAALVGYIFMHLKYDWSKLYFLILPSFILAIMMIIVLLPDIVFAWSEF